jgi:putative hydrolase of the HAD superfamily
MIKVIGFDADDTLWHDARDFMALEAAIHAEIGRYVDPVLVAEEMVARHGRDLPLYGYGIKAYLLSVIETLAVVGSDRVPARAFAHILALGREMLSRPAELLPGVAQTLEALGQRFRLILITKGDLLHQEQKIHGSGLARHFDSVEIVSDKSAETYRRIFGALSAEVPEAAMLGDSLRSDIIPALEAGAWALHIPQAAGWSHEAAPVPIDHPRYRHFDDVERAAAWLLSQP